MCHDIHFEIFGNTTPRSSLTIDSFFPPRKSETHISICTTQHESVSDGANIPAQLGFALANTVASGYRNISLPDAAPCGFPEVDMGICLMSLYRYGQ